MIKAKLIDVWVEKAADGFAVYATSDDYDECLTPEGSIATLDEAQRIVTAWAEKTGATAHLTPRGCGGDVL